MKKWKLKESDLKDGPEAPSMLEHPVFKKSVEFCVSVGKILHLAQSDHVFWLDTEEGKDLNWYFTVLPPKIGRQLENRWEIDNGSNFAKQDYKYTRYVISEILNFLEVSLNVLCKKDLRLMRPRILFRDLKREVLAI